MADYFPLLARALDTMTDRGPSARRLVYERARTALSTQLKSLEPPLGPAEFDREAHALDDAIARAEAAYGGDHDRDAGADRPDGSGIGAAVDAERHEKAMVPPAIRRTRRRRPLALAVGLAVIMVPVGIFAWLQRDRGSLPAQPAIRAPVVATAPAGDSKFADRVGAPAASSPVVVTPPAAAPQLPASPPQTPVPSAPLRGAESPSVPASPNGGAPAAAEAPAQPALAVAQRAVLVEEDPADAQQPKVTSGRALWRLDALNGGQGQPLESVVRATVDFPDAGLSMAMLMRRNTDAAFPASHTIEFTFTMTGDPPRVVRDVAPPQLKTDEASRGTPLAGLSVPVKDNVSLVGLSDLKSDVERNADLLLRRAWMDVPIRFASGRRAVLSFEKGVSGDRVLADAFRQWGSQQ